MTRRQTTPRQWLIADERNRDRLWSTVHSLPRGSGVLVLRDIAPQERQRTRRRLRRIAGLKDVTVAEEGPTMAMRVHNLRELRRALLLRTPLVLLSPLFPTASHSDWRPLPRMRAAALARLGGRRLIALGGMNAKRFRRVERLGFQAWAGISAFRT